MKTLIRMTLVLVGSTLAASFALDGLWTEALMSAGLACIGIAIADGSLT